MEPVAGQPRESPNGESAGVWLDGDSEASDRSSGTRPDARRILAILAGIVAVWLLVVIVAQVAAPDDIAQPPPTPTATPTETPVTPTAVPTPPPAPTSPPEELTDAVVGVTTSFDLPPTVQVDRMVRQLGTRGRVMAMYRAAEGMVLIDLSSGEASIVEPLDARPEQTSSSSGRTDFAGLTPADVLFRAAGQTIAVDPAALNVRLVADDASLIAASPVTDRVYWIDGRDLQGQAAGVSSLGPDGSMWRRAPHATQLVVFDTLGVAAVGKAAGTGTSLFTGGAIRDLSVHRIIDANAFAMIEQIDDTPELRVQRFDEDTWTIPSGFIGVGDRLVLSPDGWAVLRFTPQGFAEIYDARNQNVAWVTGASLEQAAWGPDSTFVVWIDLLGAPELRIMLFDQRDWLRIDLDDLDLPRPIGTELVVFERPADPEEEAGAT